MLQSASSYFLVSVTGQVEEAWFPNHDDLYCRIFWVAGQVSIYIRRSGECDVTHHSSEGQNCVEGTNAM